MEWNELRDYVLRESEKAGSLEDWSGKRRNNLIGIFKRFVATWGEERAEQIARYAFEISRGIWHGEFVGPAMFCENWDPYFAEEIDRMLKK